MSTCKCLKIARTYIRCLIGLSKYKKRNYWVPNFPERLKQSVKQSGIASGNNLITKASFSILEMNYFTANTVTATCCLKFSALLHKAFHSIHSLLLLQSPFHSIESLFQFRHPLYQPCLPPLILVPKEQVTPMAVAMVLISHWLCEPLCLLNL